MILALLTGCAGTKDTVKYLAADGSGDYTTLQEAFDAVPEHIQGGKWIIKVKPGEYYGQAILAKGKDNVVLLGEDAATTVIWHDDFAGSETKGPKQAVIINADDFTAAGITFRNPHQNIREIPGENKHSQATALSVSGDRVAFYNCRMVGNQDTFWGRGTGRIYCLNCYVEGNVDYIYGASTWVLDRCEIFSNQQDSYITAASTMPGQKFGITFLDCKLTNRADGTPDHDGVPFHNYYLGRPWHNEPRVAFIRCEEPDAIYPAGWTFMSCEPMLFAEYKCSGPGAAEDRLAMREMGGRQLSDEEAAQYTVANIFSASSFSEYAEDWLPSDHCPYKY